MRILFSLKNNIIIFVFFISLILFGCETTELQTNTNIKNTTQTTQNVFKKEKIEIIKDIEDSPSKLKTDSKTNNETKYLRVGIMLPLTGKNYQIGNSLLNASLMALNKTRNKNVKFFVRDTGNEDNITNNFYSLLNENVDVILGPIFSKSILIIQPLAKDEGVQIITFSNNSQVVQKNLYIFGLTLEDEVRSILEYSKKIKNKKLAVILPENEYGQRIKNEIIKFHSDNSSQLIKTIMYKPSDPDFYEISKNISDYEKRKINLGLKIKELESINTESSKKELKLLKSLDTYGDLPFDSLFIGVENFKQLSMISSILPYYDVDPKKIQYLGNSVWNKDSIIKEPGLNNSLFTSLNRESTAKFKLEYLELFNQKPHSIASLAYDAVGLVISLNENKKPINASSLTSKQGFVGINGTFKLYMNGNIKRNPSIYRVKNEKVYEINN